MIYYCVKTSEYLADILDKVSRETQYYFQLDVPLDRAESIIEKFQKGMIWIKLPDKEITV
jgi:hypothetical protein